MDNVCGIVVTYRVDALRVPSLAALLAQVRCLYIVDNGSDAGAIEALKQLAAEHAGFIDLTLNPTNTGIAAAQNQGIRKALAGECEWVLLLDDDSTPDARMVESMVSAWRQQQDANMGMVVPRLEEQNVEVACTYLTSWHGVGFKLQRLEAGTTLPNVTLAIASGSLIRADMLRKIGLMAERFFIDGVDHEFCLRARANGYGILAVGDAALYHRQGRKRQHELLGKRIVTQNYDPVRRYYAFRNRVFLLKSYGRQFPFLFLYVWATCGWDMVRIVCFEERAISKIKACLRGLWHGITFAAPKAN